MDTPELHGTPTMGYYWVLGESHPVQVSRLYATIEDAEQAKLNNEIEWAD